jgi:hypothetical protein
VANGRSGEAQGRRPGPASSLLLALPIAPGAILLILAASYLLGDSYCEPFEQQLFAALPSGLGGLLLLTAGVAIRVRARSGYSLGWFVGLAGSAASAALAIMALGSAQAGGESGVFASGFVVVAALALATCLGLALGLWRARSTFAAHWQPADVVVGIVLVAATVVFVGLRVLLVVPGDLTPEDCSPLAGPVAALLG